MQEHNTESKIGTMNQTHKSGLAVMAGLIGLIRPLLGVMLLAIIMGTIGHLMATFITILGGVGIGAVLGVIENISLGKLFAILIVFAILRGVLRYAEQASNHFIAFKLLAQIRHHVFAALRKLAPAKLDGSDKGNLISIITSDIELLEVFYAHTISPIAIAGTTSVVMCLFIGHYHVMLGLLAAGFYLLVGVVIPVINSHMGQGLGREYRKVYGQLNTTVLDNLYGLEEILQFGQTDARLEKMQTYTEELEGVNRRLKNYEMIQRVITDGVILIAGVVMALCGAKFVSTGNMEPIQVIICTIAMMSSFGPTAALSALSNNLNQTLASGNRVLGLLEEEPMVKDIVGSDVISRTSHQAAGLEQPLGGGLSAEQVTFSYDNAAILRDYSISIKENTIHGILGQSGCGKSTLLKLFMRFYETEKGRILYGDRDVNEIETAVLRSHVAYVTQDTFLFSDTIENNIKIAKADATREEVIAAAKKAAIHDFISALPKGYDTRLAELGDSVSGGERQRIGLARAFLHDAKVILLDEPTSNIDSLNEGIILHSLKSERAGRTMVLVSHRASTMGIADEITRM